MSRYIAGAQVLICGASYRQDVGDTRYSGSEMVVRKLTEMGAEMRVHDPYVDRWWEFESQDDYPSNSKAVFFRNQRKLKDLQVLKVRLVPKDPQALKEILVLKVQLALQDYLVLQDHSALQDRLALPDQLELQDQGLHQRVALFLMLNKR
jgi:hypothetical protein